MIGARLASAVTTGRHFILAEAGIQIPCNARQRLPDLPLAAYSLQPTASSTPAPSSPHLAISGKSDLGEHGVRVIHNTPWLRREGVGQFVERTGAGAS
jgi:hypothetical protein